MQRLFIITFSKVYIYILNRFYNFKTNQNKNYSNEPMDPRLLLQLSAKKIIKEKHIFEQDEGGLSQINYLTPLWVIFIPSVTFDPLCTPNFMQNIRKKYDFHF